MKLMEKVTVTREIDVAPCVKCGGDDIDIYDCGYSTFNVGGGECRTCGHKVTNNHLGCFPTKTELAAIWNAGNDLEGLIKAEKDKIENARARITELEKRRK